MSIVCFGEILLRLSPPNGHRFGQTTTFEAVFGGSEANVAVALAYWGASSSFISRLPDNDIGKAALGALSRYGVQTQHVSFGGERLGIYFLEQGMGRRAGKVIYDRKHSGMDTLEPGQIDWEKAFEKVTWFHWSGITAALSASAASVLEEALTFASKRQITISCDLNYRETLWKYGKTPEMVMPGLVAHCHVLLGDPTSFDVCLNVRDNSKEAMLKSVTMKFPKLTHIAMSERGGISATHNTFQGILFDGKDLFYSNKYDLPDILDRMGAGDAMMAGLIYGLSKKSMDAATLINFAGASAAMKHYIRGDFNLSSLHEIRSLMDGNSGSKVHR